MVCQQVARDIDAYVDGELADAVRYAFDTHLEGCAACRRSVGEREALGRLVRSAPYYAAPARLRERVTTGAVRVQRRRSLRNWAAVAAAIVVLALGAGISEFRVASNQRHSLTEEVVSGHLRSLMADHLVDVRSEDQHTVKPWFLGKLDFAPPVVDLAASGFPLVGGRIDYLDGQPAAALVYQRRQHTINVFVLPARDGHASDVDAPSIRGFHVRHWTHGDLSFWAVSDVSDDELDVFIHALQGAS